MNKLIFKIDNNREDYFPIYPELNKNTLFINKWVKYLLGLFLFLVIVAFFLSIKSPSVKKEYAYAWTAAIVVLVVLIAKIVESMNKKKKASTFVNHLIPKGPAQITVDQVGIEIKYPKEIKIIEWSKQGHVHLENDYLMITDRMGNPISIIPKGNILDKKWLEIQENISAIIKKSTKKRYGFDD